MKNNCGLQTLHHSLYFILSFKIFFFFQACHLFVQFLSSLESWHFCFSIAVRYPTLILTALSFFMLFLFYHFYFIFFCFYLHLLSFLEPLITCLSNFTPFKIYFISYDKQKFYCTAIFLAAFVNGCRLNLISLAAFLFL